MRQEAKRRQFLGELGLSPEDLVRPQQVHQHLVHRVTVADRGKEISGADGLVFVRDPDNVNQPILAVFGADCVPVLLVDPVAKITAVAHAGWKGTLEGVVTETAKAMFGLGATARNILAVIGPRIGVCCYDISTDRALLFQQAFPDTPKAVVQTKNRWFLDLGYINCRQLKQVGIEPAHIDNSLLCVSCQNQDFFSFRKNGKDGFGEIMGIVAFVSRQKV